MGRRYRKSGWRHFLEKLHNPPNWVAIITVVSACVVCPLAILALWLDEGHSIIAVVACALCGILLIYAVAVTINSIVKLRKKVLKVADRYEFTRNLRKNYEFRTLFFGAVSFLCNIGYMLFLIGMAFYYRSIWYGAIGVYYILLSVARGGILLQNRKDERTYRYDFHKLQTAKVGTYRYCGVMMLVLAFSLAVSVVELVVSGSGFRNEGWLIYVFAAVAAYKVIHAFIHFIHSTKRDDLVVRSVRYVNMAVTLMSVLCLQTSIIAAYPIAPERVALFNGITGTVVWGITFLLGLYMIIFSTQEKKRLLETEVRLAQTVDVLQPMGYNRDGYLDECDRGKIDFGEEIEHTK